MTQALIPGRIVALDKSHLELLVRSHQDKYTDACDLNHIDVSRVTDMRKLFSHSFFTGDISRWDVSNVINMEQMFSGSIFDGDISQWNVSNVRCMDNMFSASYFRGSLENWNTGQVKSMDSMFQGARFDSPIGNWNVEACDDFCTMFASSRFNQDISQWDMRRAKNVGNMFHDSPFAHDIAQWKLPLSCRMVRMFDNDSPGMKAQRPADWHAKLHLDNWSLPGPGLLLDALVELQGIHEALGGSNEERARDLVRAVVAKRQGKGAGPPEGESWAIDGLIQ